MKTFAILYEESYPKLKFQEDKSLGHKRNCKIFDK